ncbi:transposase [Acidimicrobium ferrooxidans]|nr:transposase [Acidimicrobium ferrooxidans]
MPAHDREGLEHLVRYTARPAVSDQRLSKRRDGKVVPQLRRPWADGTPQIVFDPLALIEKLAALVPRPMANLVRYHGYFAPAAPWRAEIVPAAPETDVAHPPAITSPDYDPACQLPADQGPGRSGRWIPWATLLHRVFGFEVLDCEN